MRVKTMVRRVMATMGGVAVAAITTFAALVDAELGAVDALTGAREL